MFQYLDHFGVGYDLRLLGLAIFICVIASFTALSILGHVYRTAGQMREIWLWVAAVASGSGIWATQFITMLAYDPEVPKGYDLRLTLLSLLAAILLTGVGLSMVAAALRGGRWIGGVMVGVGIGATHYIAVAAYEVAARLVWDSMLVAASLAFAMVVGAVALPVGMRNGEAAARGLGVVLLSLAICGHNFIAMRAARLIPDLSIRVPESALPAGWIALGVALASLTILVFSGIGLALDVRERHRAKREVDRMRGLADASAEGLLVCKGDKVVTINATMTEWDGARLGRRHRR